MTLDESNDIRPLTVELLRLARPKQWAKSVFVLIGPAYGLTDLERPWLDVMLEALIAAVAFSLLSSGLYVFNDIIDVDRDRAHPRKRRRPIASGVVSTTTAWIFAGILIALAAATTLLLDPQYRLPAAALLAIYALNVVLYTLLIKRVIIADVIGLSLGFVIRVIGGCVAVGIWPSTWLLNCTFFIAMFLAFGKRLGERATMGEHVASVRPVQAAYTTDLLRMTVVVTAVAALVTYSAYVQARGEQSPTSFNLLWLTVLPATYGLLRCIVLLENGAYDDPTELAAGDRPFQAGLALFGAITLLVLWKSVSGRP